jgi:hypothetical protein
LTIPVTYANSRAHLLSAMRNIHHKTQPARLGNLTPRDGCAIYIVVARRHRCGSRTLTGAPRTMISSDRTTLEPVVLGGKLQMRTVTLTVIGLVIASSCEFAQDLSLGAVAGTNLTEEKPRNPRRRSEEVTASPGHCQPAHPSTPHRANLTLDLVLSYLFTA